MRKLQMVFMSLAAMFFATPAFAQGTTGPVSNWWVSIAAGIGMARAVPEIGRSERDRWQLFDDYNPRNATTAVSGSPPTATNP